jgi:thioredoxin-dependent peroxiredoxin
MATMILQEGDNAPAIDLKADSGGRFRLADQAGKAVVVYFYPKDDTSGCTREAQEFTARKPEFDEVDTEIVGVSPDEPGSHDKFKAKHGLLHRLASDPEKAVLDAYGVWGEKSMYGRKYMGVERSTFLIDRQGKIAKIWRKVKVPGHVEDVLDTARLIASTTG